MSVVALDYSAMKNAVKAAKGAADRCEDYAGEIEKKVSRKLADLRLGSSANTSQADYFARQKISSLRSGKLRYEQLSRTVEEAIDYAKETDRADSEFVRSESQAFRARHDMDVHPAVEFFVWLSTSKLNSSALGRWFGERMSDVDRWVSNAVRSFRQWYQLDGGKYIIKAALAIVGTVAAAVTLIFVAIPALVAAGTLLAGGITAAALWTAVTATACLVTSVVAIADNATKVVANASAAIMTMEDPGWAKRLNSYRSFSTFLRKNNFGSGKLNKLSMTWADIISVSSTVAATITIVDIARTGANFLKNINSDEISTLFRPVRFRAPGGKVTWGTFKYGMKSLKMDLKALKEGFFTTNISRINDSFKNQLGMIGPLELNRDALSDLSDLLEKGPGALAVDKIRSAMKDYDVVSSIKEKLEQLLELIKEIKGNIYNS